jgi:selenide,water dikinase
MVDLAKRKRVMARSMQLGHCICDPKKPCPCDVFQEHGVCPCAGERLPPAPGPVRLTQLVDNPGCASKIDEATLTRVLGGLPSLEDPRVLIGMPAGDDAGVYRIDENVTLVQTVDVFSPSVDDPYVFGQIAAANSLSDVYAMGGRPITALSIIGFPVRSVPEEAMREILRGGIDKMSEAGVPVIGGHSINDKEIKAGFAVTGLVDPAKIVSNAGAKPGDLLLLTKPLGTGVLAFAAQIGRAPEGAMEAAARSMAQLNRQAGERMVEFGVRAGTDITGFGLMGHLSRLAAASGVDLEIVWDDLPLLPGVLRCAAEGIFSGAVERNRESSEAAAVAGEGVSPLMLDLCFDPQTSGGLLMAVRPKVAEALLTRLHEDGMTDAAIIGRVTAQGTGRVVVRTEGRRQLPTVAQDRRDADPTRSGVGSAASATNACCEPEEAGTMGDCENERSCCGGAESGTFGQAVVGEAQQKFLDFLHVANAAGALDARTKRAIAIALSVLSKCEPCVKSHVKKAREEGFTQEEIDEAAWIAIAFGGSPTMMFYNGLRRST